MRDRQIDTNNLATEQAKAKKSKVAHQLTLSLNNQNKTIQIPFTEIDTVLKMAKIPDSEA